MNNENKTNINWYPGHMAKAKRLIKEQLSYIDVVYEVIDARMPYSSKMQDMDDLLQNKPRILVMTKMDLCDKTETEKFMKHYEKEGYMVVPMDLEHTSNLKPLLKATEEVTKDSVQKRLDKGMLKRRTRILVVGIPNVGKSTLINRLVGKKAVDTGNRPGVTKQVNWIRINEDLELLDTPGILWPKLEQERVAFNLASLTAIREEILPLFKVIEYILNMLSKYYPDKLKERYGIEEIDEDIVDTLDKIGKKRGCLIKGGDIDYDKVFALILNDIKNGYVQNITFDRFEEIYG